MPKFLIVDDDVACRSLEQAFLAPFGRCDLAYDGHEAIGAFRIALEAGEPYDLVCLDIMMPGFDGHKVLDAIRSLERQRGIFGNDGVKVVMATALADSKHCIRAFKEGCESYITKPIDEQELLTQVRNLLGELPVTGSPPKPAQPAPLPAAAPAAASPPRYLIVDDDGVSRELLKDILSRYGRCDFAYDGTEAIDAVRLAMEDTDHYDLICLDIMMPGCDGHEVLETIRSLEAEHGIANSEAVRVIMTTALRDSKHCVRAFREGCESYLTKPINQEKLLTKMRELGLTLTPCEAEAPA
jgi:two-component system chemotaxis response regulator CheY